MRIKAVPPRSHGMIYGSGCMNSCEFIFSYVNSISPKSFIDLIASNSARVSVHSVLNASLCARENQRVLGPSSQ